MASLQEIDALAGQLAQLRERLAAAIAASPELFTDKRSIVVHGIKTGFAPAVSALSWDDDAAVAGAIRQQLPDRFRELVEVTERPLKEALVELDTDMLLSLGVRVKPSDARVIVRFTKQQNDAQMTLKLEPSS